MSDGLSDIAKTLDRVRSMMAKKYSSYALTELGKVKAEEYGGTGLEWEILNHLNDNGPCKLKEIEDGVDWPREKVKVAVERLIEQKRIMMV